MNTKFESLVTCRGFIVDDKPNKLRFMQDYNDCWIQKENIRKIEPIEKTSEGYTYALITVQEELANALELEGVLE
jgi:hypothetical protein